MTQEEIRNDYQERSLTANSRAQLLVWVLIGLFALQLILGTSYAQLNIGFAGACTYLILSTIQSCFQSFACWRCLVDCENFSRDAIMDKYPDYIRNVAWIIYLTKMAVIIATTIYVIWKFLI